MWVIESFLGCVRSAMISPSSFIAAGVADTYSRETLSARFIKRARGRPTAGPCYRLCD